jgi:hypothetical protein
MRIECTDTFLDGRDRFEKGDTRSVPDADAQRFIASGWAIEVGSGAAPVAATQAETVLSVHNVKHTMKKESRNG